MSAEFSHNRREKIQPSRASSHDARFIAALDLLNYQGTLPVEEYADERKAFWKSRLEDRSAEVFVAREGGLYVGYLAVNDSMDGPSHELVINPTQAHLRSDIIDTLVRRAGVVIEVPAIHQAPELTIAS